MGEMPPLTPAVAVYPSVKLSSKPSVWMFVHRQLRITVWSCLTRTRRQRWRRWSVRRSVPPVSDAWLCRRSSGSAKLVTGSRRWLRKPRSWKSTPVSCRYTGWPQTWNTPRDFPLNLENSWNSVQHRRETVTTDLFFVCHSNSCVKILQCESKKSPLRGPDIFHFVHKRLRIFKRFFTHLLYVRIYAKLQIFIQLSPILTKLCHIKRDYPGHIICSKCPPSVETHALTRFRKSLIALLMLSVASN